ncbi:MAG: hypothetical protein LBF88_09115 [Planctomycetaceae bacterium]|jgi:hypothetical protein|nr:hypothetical protein [Planctomycetaceae bacterium]
MNKQYEKMLPSWQYVDDCYEGITIVKSYERRTKYLIPFPSEKNKVGKDTQYDVRCHFADYDNIFRSAIVSMIGIMNRNAPVVQFDEGEEKITPQEVRDIDIWGNKYDDRLTGLKVRLNHAQVLRGRAGLLLDIALGESKIDPQFIIKEYSAYSILDGENYQSPIDGKDRLKWIQLDESAYVFNCRTKTRDFVNRYRILGLDENGYYYTSVLEGSDIESQWKNFDLDHPVNAVYPNFKGEYISFIPFTVCNVDRLGIDEWQPPPFIDMAYSTINAYNVDSLYKQSLVNHARATLVISNAKPIDNVVLGQMLQLTSASSAYPASAALLETSGTGLAAMGNCTDKVKDNALRRTIQGVLEAAGANSSGEALKIRTAAGTATIAEIDSVSGRAIEEQLCFAARWAGATLREVGERISFKVDTSYMGDEATLQEIVSLMTANRSSGRALLSRRNIYALLAKRVPSVLSSYEDNELQLEDEELADASTNTATGDLLSTLFQQQSENDEDEEEEENDEDNEDDENIDNDNKKKKKK